MKINIENIGVGTLTSKGSLFWNANVLDDARANRVRVKICGVRSLDAAYNAWESGVDAIGIHGVGIHHMDLVKTYSDWLVALPSGLSIFLLTQETNIDILTTLISKCGFDTIQFQGLIDATDLKKCSSVLRKMGIKVVKSIGVNDLGPVKTIEYAKQISSEVDAIILDSTFAGGEGLGHDWAISEKLVKLVDIPVILAGGINAQNIHEALQLVKPYALDIETGSEVRIQIGENNRLTVKSYSKMIDIVKEVYGSQKKFNENISESGESNDGNTLTSI